MTQELMDTVKQLTAPGKGILAADESNPTVGKRFAPLEIPNTGEFRMAYRKLLFETDGLENRISGVILYEETLRQNDERGMALREILAKKGVVTGIKVDKGTVPLPGRNGEKVTEGLDGLRRRLEEYRALGARFAKWRAVIDIGKEKPSRYALLTNARVLARYARLCQEAGLVPIVEPEVMMDGSHSLETCFAATRDAQHALFQALYEAEADLEGLLLKPNMVVPGRDSLEKPSPEQVASATLKCLRTSVPTAVPGIFFLSGGQSPEDAVARLQAMAARGPHPWELSFSFARALQEPALAAWKGRPESVADAQMVFSRRVELAGAARSGTYSPEMETSSKPASTTVH